VDRSLPCIAFKEARVLAFFVAFSVSRLHSKATSGRLRLFLEL
jgi:hypothetical protein